MSHKRTILSLSLTISLIYSMLPKKKTKKNLSLSLWIGEKYTLVCFLPWGKEAYTCNRVQLDLTKPTLLKSTPPLSLLRKYNSVRSGIYFFLCGSHMGPLRCECEEKYTLFRVYFSSLFFSYRKICPRGFNSHAYADLPTIF